MSLKTTHLTLTILAIHFLSPAYAFQDKTSHPSEQEVRSHIDSLLSANMSKQGIPGLAYVIVKADSIFLMGASGMANLETKQPIDPQSTLFLMGSNAKPVTAAAVMQLVEKGLVDLDTDVNQYIQSFQIPYSVTLRQLLTHTGGIEDQSFNRIRLHQEELTSLSVYLENNLPNQIFPPGTIGAYSNHGVALAGLVVEEVSGLSFYKYAATHIFKPLQMPKSTFTLAEQDEKYLARSYDRKGNKWIEEPIEYVSTIPSSMLISTVKDMAMFMIAQLNQGMFKNASFMSSSSVAQMQAQQFTHHPIQLGRALGLFESSDREKRVLTHGGTRQSHISYMYLIPEEQLGIYLAYNGGSRGFRTQFTDHVIDLWLPNFQRSEPDFIQTNESLKEYTGTFYSNRRNETSIEKLIRQFSTGKAQASLSSDSTLNLFGTDFQLQSKDQFNTKDGSFPIFFGRNEKGAIQYLLLPGRNDSYELFPWYKQEMVHVIILALCLILFLVLTIRFTFITAMHKEISQLGKSTHLLAINYFLFLASFIATIAVLQKALQYGTPHIFYFTFSLPFVGFIILVPILRNLHKSWPIMIIKVRSLYSAYLVVILLFNLELYYWNFIGYHF